MTGYSSLQFEYPVPLKIYSFGDSNALSGSTSSSYEGGVCKLTYLAEVSFNNWFTVFSLVSCGKEANLGGLY